MNFSVVFQFLLTLHLGLALLFSPGQSGAMAQTLAMQRCAGKLLDAAEKCKPRNFKPYEQHVKANIHAGRHDTALELMKVDAAKDPMPRLVDCIKLYAFSMGRAGRADEVDDQLAFFKTNSRVKPWLEGRKTSEFESIYRQPLCTGTALHFAAQGNLDQALETIKRFADPKTSNHSVLNHQDRVFKQMLVYLINEGEAVEAAKAIKIHFGSETNFGSNTSSSQEILRLFHPTPGKSALALLEHYPELATEVIKNWNSQYEQNDKFKWKAFQKIAANASPEQLQAIEIEALGGNFLPVDYENRIVTRSLKQIPKVDPDSNLDIAVFDNLLRRNKLDKAKELFDSSDPFRASCFEGLELTERLFNHGENQDALAVLDRVIVQGMTDEFGSFVLFSSALRLGELDAAAAILKSNQERNGKKDNAIDSLVLEFHRTVHDSGFQSGKLILDTFKSLSDSLSTKRETDGFSELQKFQEASMIHHLIAELAIKGEPRMACEATLGLPDTLFRDKPEVGPVMLILLARGQDQKAIEFAKCLKDAPADSFCLGTGFFSLTCGTLSQIKFELKPETEREIFAAIGPKLLKEFSYMNYAIEKALNEKDEDEAFRLAKIELGHTESIDTLGFTKLNWHEKLIALAESFKNAETKRNVVDSVADDLFESKRIDELISHLEKHTPIGVHQKPHQSRFNRLIRYAWVADKLYYSDR